MNVCFENRASVPLTDLDRYGVLRSYVDSIRYIQHMMSAMYSVLCILQSYKQFILEPRIQAFRYVAMCLS